MRTMTRYVISQLLGVFVLSVVAITLLMILVGLVRQARQEGVGFGQIVQLLPFVLPEALVFAVPATALFSVSMVYGRMSSANEVVALKSLGISPWTIIWPMLVLATLLSLASVWLNDLTASWGHPGMKRIVIASIEEIAYARLQTQRTYSTGRFSIAVRQVDGRRLLEPTVTLQADHDAPAIIIRAESAELHADPSQNTLTILLHNGTVTAGEMKVNFPGDEKRILPLSENQKPSPTEMALSAIPQAIAAQKDRIEDLEQQLAARASFDLLIGEFGDLSPQAWSETRLRLDSEQEQLHRLEAEPCRRWAAGFSCLCFVMVGAPMAIRMRNHDFLTSFFLCFAPILAVYGLLLVYSFDRAKEGTWPPSAAWLGNGVLVLWSAWLMRRVLRY